MNPGEETQTPTAAPFSAEAESFLSSAENAEKEIAGDQPSAPVAEPEKNPVQPCDFRTRMLLAPGELRKLRMHQEEFANSLASRLSLHLRLDFLLKLTDVQTVAYGKVAQGWQSPTHLTLFKVEPLRGISVLEIPLPLGFSIVDRLMGGPGESADSDREISEIENALLDQAIQLILGEWCSHWTKHKQLKPALLGFETNGKFVQAAVPETMMLVISLDAQIGNCTGQIQIAFPYNSLEGMIRELNRSVDAPPVTEAAPVAPVKPVTKWNSCFDDVCIPAVAELQGIEMSARDVLALKIGDVLKITGKDALNVKLRLADAPKFNGRLGTLDGNWAVELTEIIKH
ncbi:MAG TPA: flagellar motor switch protein FliM [Verrucomicrobiae bacterium]|jgi:flagellar motor switch protein FliM